MERHVISLKFPTTQQSHAFFTSPRTSPIAASGATNVKNVIRIVRQCKSTLHLTVRTVSHLVPVIHIQLPEATVPVSSSLHTNTERSTLYLRGELEIGTNHDTMSQCHKRNNVSLDSKAQRSSEQTNTLNFCPRSCCSNLKQP